MLGKIGTKSVTTTLAAQLKDRSMNSAIANTLIVRLARLLNCPPIVAHVLIMLGVTIGFGSNHPELYHKWQFAMLWFGVCSFVVLVTWLTKGPYRDAWLKTSPWQQ